MIEYRQGDLFMGVKESLAAGNRVAIAHVCNDEGGWGSGFVVPLGKNYPLAESEYRRWCAEGSTVNKDFDEEVPFELGKTQFVYPKPIELGGLVVANMIGQHQTINSNPGSTPVRYAAIADCLERVSDYCVKAQGGHETHNTIEVHCPKFGAGLAGGNWTVIEALLDEIVGSVAPVIVYEMTEKEMWGRELLAQMHEAVK